MATPYKILILCIGFALSNNLWAQGNNPYFEECKTIDFGKKLGIDIINISHEIDEVNDNDFLLNLNLRKKLLVHIVPEQYVANPDYSAYLCSIRQISDSTFLVEYGLMGFDIEAAYLASYTIDGLLKDSMFAGNCWNFGDAETIDDENGTERIYTTTTECDFLSPNTFNLTLKTRQSELEYNPEKETELYLFQAITKYSISDEGLLNILSTDIKEQGTFVGWEDDPFFNDTVELNRIDMLPQSIPNKYSLYSLLGEKGGEIYELLLDSIYNFAYAVNPNKMLNWIYDNKNKEVTTFLNALYDKYEKFDWARNSIRNQISLLDDIKKKDYFFSLIEEWEGKLGANP
ncbi:hypothetical protein [Muribaculum intestinale]|uniref:hypothetical protein n=1 Tax=Muribaculum intestinale TaxID=1796646 RepID=UPI00242AA877|nr:hypothetical protein [Muribaculum intestinale]